MYLEEMQVSSANLPFILISLALFVDKFHSPFLGLVVISYRLKYL